MKKARIRLGAAGLFLLLTGTPSFAEVTGTVRVVDGDTLEMLGQTIKLYGVDAIERDQLCLSASDRPWPCGGEAASALRSLVGGAPVRCEPISNRAGAILAVCELRGEDLAAAMVRRGWALADRSVSFEYVGDEDSAKSVGTGIWNSAFVLPWEWRAGKRLEIPEIDQSKPTEQPPSQEPATSTVPAYGPLNMGP